MNRTLFTRGEFISHSGLKLGFKIDCDFLADDDLECIAEYIASKTSFGVVHGIPRGGARLATALEQYAACDAAPFNTLVVDDVMSTGASMEDAKAGQPPQVHPDDVVGWVIFARCELPSWIHAVFQMGN